MELSMRLAAEADADAVLDIYNSNPDFLLHHLDLERVDAAFLRREQEEMRAEPAFVTKPGFVAGPSCAAQPDGMTKAEEERMIREAADPAFAGPVHTRSAKGL